MEIFEIIFLRLNHNKIIKILIIIFKKRFGKINGNNIFYSSF